MILLTTMSKSLFYILFAVIIITVILEYIYALSKLYMCTHSCGCVDGDCCPESCWVEDYSNELQMLHCQLFGLPDLNHDVDYVATELINWIVGLIKNWVMYLMYINSIFFAGSHSLPTPTSSIRNLMEYDWIQCPT